MKIYIIFLPIQLLFAQKPFLQFSGDNLIWAPKKNEFMYSILGKETDKKIWKLYSIETKESRTIFYGTIQSLPIYSNSGEIIAWGEKNILTFYYPSLEKTTNFSLPIPTIVYISFSDDDKKIAVADLEKIYIFDIQENKTKFCYNATSPVWKNKIFLVDFESNLWCETNLIEKKIRSFKLNNGTVVIEKTDGLIILNLLKNTKEFIPIEKIEGYDIANDNTFIVYGAKNKGIFFYFLETKEYKKIFDIGSYPKISKTMEYISYEKRGNIFIYPLKK